MTSDIASTKCNNCQVELKENDDVIPISFDDNIFKHVDCLQITNTKRHNDPFKHMRDEIDRQGNLIVSLLSQQRDLNNDIRRVAKEIGFDLDD